MAEWEPDKLGLSYVLRHPKGPVGEYIKDRTATLYVLARFQVGTKTFDLYKSIGFDVKSGADGLVGTVTAADRKAIMHHNGTRAHLIYPNKAKTLRFSSRGRIVYAKVVRHPGTKPNKFLTDNLPKVIN